MKNQIVALIALAASLATLALHFIQKPSKVGYAETAVLMSEFSEAVKARKEFEAAQKGWDANLKILNDSLNSAMESMKAGYDNAGEAGKSAMREKLQKSNSDLQRYTTAVKKMAQDKERELMDPVIKKVNSFLDQWGQENGYDIILGTLSGGSILQANTKLNVTRPVLKDLNSHYASLPEAGEKPQVPAMEKDSVKVSLTGAKKAGSL